MDLFLNVLGIKVKDFSICAYFYISPNKRIRGGLRRYFLYKQTVQWHKTGKEIHESPQLMLLNPNSYYDSKDYSILAASFALIDAKEETYQFFFFGGGNHCACVY